MKTLKASRNKVFLLKCFSCEEAPVTLLPELSELFESASEGEDFEGFQK